MGYKMSPLLIGGDKFSVAKAYIREIESLKKRRNARTDFLRCHQN
jgi:hypothetical protein